MNNVLVVLLVAIAAYVAWTMYQNGWDLKKGAAALIAAGAAWWAWANDAVSTLTNGM